MRGRADFIVRTTRLQLSRELAGLDSTRQATPIRPEVVYRGYRYLEASFQKFSGRSCQCHAAQKPGDRLRQFPVSSCGCSRC